MTQKNTNAYTVGTFSTRSTAGMNGKETTDLNAQNVVTLNYKKSRKTVEMRSATKRTQRNEIAQ